MHTQRHDVITLVPHVIINPLGGYITFHPAPPIAGMQTVATVLARLSTNSLQPLYRHVGIGVDGSRSLLVLFHIPLYLLLEVSSDQIRPLFKSAFTTVEVDLV